MNIHMYSNSIRPAQVPMIIATCFKGSVRWFMDTVNSHIYLYMIYINIQVYSNSIRPAQVPMIKATCFKGRGVRVRVNPRLGPRLLA